MADDQFTAQMEWLLRVRREHVELLSLLREVRKFVRVAGSSQDERDVRRWVSAKVEQMYVDLDRAITLLSPEWAKYLDGPVVKHGGYLPRGTAGAGDLDGVDQNGVKGDLPDRRPIQGPGRRHGNIRHL